MHVEAYECLYPGENDISYIIFMQDNVFIDMLSSQLIGNHRLVNMTPYLVITVMYGSDCLSMRQVILQRSPR